jgi:hypothetical protein
VRVWGVPFRKSVANSAKTPSQHSSLRDNRCPTMALCVTTYTSAFVATRRVENASCRHAPIPLYRDNCCTTRFSHVHRNSVEQPIENACDAPCASNASAKSSQLSVFLLERRCAAFICNCWMSVFDRWQRSWSKSGPVYSQNVVREAKNAARGVRMRAQFERCRYRSMRLRRDIDTTFDTRTTCVRSGWSVRRLRPLCLG